MTVPSTTRRSLAASSGVRCTTYLLRPSSARVTPDQLRATVAIWPRGPDMVNEVVVRNRIYALVHYLQSIQEPAEAAEN